MLDQGGEGFPPLEREFASWHPDSNRQPRRRALTAFWIALAGAVALALALVVLVVRNGSRPKTPDGPPVAAKGPGGDDRPKDADKAKDTDPDRKKDKPPDPLPKSFKNALGMEFVLVSKGKSWLGGGGGKPGDKEVTIRRDFYLGRYEVTQEEWQNVMGSNPSYFSRTGKGKEAVQGVPDDDLKRFPVENVSWDNVQLFLAKLNKRVKESGWVYRLPKEAEWEYACRGGPMREKHESAFDYYLDKPANVLLPAQANFSHALARPCKVGSFRPNRLGLYDMHGNVWEWCDDEGPDPNNPKGLARRTRGGSWGADSGGLRADRRNAVPPSTRYPDHGLRVARVPVGAEAEARRRQEEEAEARAEARRRKEEAEAKAEAEAEARRRKALAAEAKRRKDIALAEAEQKAAYHLRYAKKLLADDDTLEKGKERLREIIKDFPETKSAKEAQELLKELPK
jgi:formylglycine-generating enzyme required for sulfatase activity